MSAKSRYVELQVTSNFSFLRGASHPDELFRAAQDHGYGALAMTDRNSLAGIVRGHVVAKDNAMRLIVGCRLDLTDGPSLLAYPTDRAAYARLAQLLTLGNLRAPKGECHLVRADVYDHAEGLLLVAVPPYRPDDAFAADLADYKRHFRDRLYLAAAHYYQGEDARRIAQLARLARRCGIPLVAVNDVHYHAPERRALQDVVTCIREKCTIYDAGYRLHHNAERHLKSPQEMARLFKAYPNAIRRTAEIAAACRFSLEELRYEYPDEITSDGRTPQEELAHLTWLGAAERFPAGVPDTVRATLDKELAFIAEHSYAPFFLTVYDAVRFAREQKILCQGRGSAANSVVCYCLGITSVNPTEIDLLFERFLSSARNEPPDIDVDFEHERREEVMQYIFDKYGRDRAGIVATVVEYRQRGALRDVGKAMGLSADVVDRLAGALWEYTREWLDEDKVTQQGLDPFDPHLRRTVALAEELMGFPRHLSQHTGGFVITRGRLGDLCPVMNAAMAGRTCIEWNKDDIDALGFLKVDVLALGMLTCVRKAFDLIGTHYGRALTLANIPQGDAATYDMICKADTIGTFQIESRAQMTMLPRLKPRCLYDLVIEVAIVRPGPIQGDMVHPYLRRREGKEHVDYPSPEMERILKKTLGVPLFQEQAMAVAIVAGGFSPADADRLRRSMATFKAVGSVNDFERKLLAGMKANGYPDDFAQRLFSQLQGFGSYGFPESHAASFALLVYVSSWLKRHYPDVFACALLNSQPMGFYAPAQIVQCARNHGVEMRPVDVNHSAWDCLLEADRAAPYAVRIGFRQVKGLGEEEMTRLVAARAGGYASIADLRHRAGIGIPALETLARADTFRSLGLDRRQALWDVKALPAHAGPVFAGRALPEVAVDLPAMGQAEHVVQDYAWLTLSLKAHPVSFMRPRLDRLKAVRLADLPALKSGLKIKLAGLVIIRQRPPTAKDIVFVTVEDDTGIANLVLFKRIFEQFRRELLTAKLLLVEGKLEKEGDVIHVIVSHLSNLSPWLEDLATPDTTGLPLFDPKLSESVMPAGRNFH